LATARFTCEPGGLDTAGREELGKGGSIGSNAARAVGAEEDGKCTFDGKFASETGVVVGVAEARITAGGGAAHPQSKGTSLLTRSILPS
jgi:hypothetical protein